LALRLLHEARKSCWAEEQRKREREGQDFKVVLRYRESQRLAWAA